MRVRLTYTIYNIQYTLIHKSIILTGREIGEGKIVLYNIQYTIYIDTQVHHTDRQGDR